MRRGANAQGLSDGARTRTPGAPHARPHPLDSTGARAAPASRSGIRPPAPAEGPPDGRRGAGRRNPRGARCGPRRVYFAGDFCPAELYLLLAAFLNFPASLKQRVNRFTHPEVLRCLKGQFRTSAQIRGRGKSVVRPRAQDLVTRTFAQSCGSAREIPSRAFYY